MTMETILGPIQERMQKTEERLHSDVTPADKRLSDLVFHIGKIKGKRFRPALLFLAGGCAGKLVPQHIDLAIVV